MPANENDPRRPAPPPEETPRTRRIRRRSPGYLPERTPSAAPASPAADTRELTRLLEGERLPERTPKAGPASPAADTRELTRLLEGERLPERTPSAGPASPAADTRELARLLEGERLPERTPNARLAGAKRNRPSGGTGQFKRPRKQRKRRFRSVRKRIFLALLSLFFCGVLAAGFFFVYTTRNDDLWLDLETIPYRTETVLYYTDENAQTGTYFTIPCTQNKEYVDYGEIPQALKDAFVAVEDKDFYTHLGFSFGRTAYAAANEAVRALTGRYIGGDAGLRQGASTITQQLIKNLTRDDEGSSMAGYMRKLREICRAVRLDALYTKDEILSAYLNSISFTGNTAGVQAEAKKLFGKTVDKLSLAECASIACITRNPARYNPVTHPENHLERRNYVLGAMLGEGYITQAQYDGAAAEPLVLAGGGEPRLPAYVTDYFTDTVLDAVITEFSSRCGLTRTEASNLVYNGGLRIYTTVAPRLQQAMEQVMENKAGYPKTAATVQKQQTDEDGAPLTDAAGNPVYGDVQVTPQGAMVSLGYDGGICAVVGGLGEKTISRGLNRATQAARQVGSTMKAIGPYVTALQHGAITWSSPFMDEPVQQTENPDGTKTAWPANASGAYTGQPVLVHRALAQSVNTVAVRVGQQAGERRIWQFLKNDLGLSSLTQEDAAPGPLCLGSTTYGITPLHMAMAYAMFGNGGYTVTPHCFTRVDNGAGGTLLAVKTGRKRVIDEETAYIMNRLLAEVMANGTAAGFSVNDGMDSVGKTGTSNEGRDHWFIGLTPYYVTASWLGYDENLPLEVSRQNHPPTAAWRAVMRQGQQGLPPRAFPVSGGVAQHSYCTQSGSAAGPRCPAATGYYRQGRPPARGCPLHGD